MHHGEVLLSVSQVLVNHLLDSFTLQLLVLQDEVLGTHLSQLARGRYLADGPSVCVNASRQERLLMLEALFSFELLDHALLLELVNRYHL